MSGALSGLTGTGGRVKVHDAQMVIKVPGAVKSLVEEASKAEDVSQATIIRWALADFFEKRGIAASR